MACQINRYGPENFAECRNVAFDQKQWATSQMQQAQNRAWTVNFLQQRAFATPNFMTLAGGPKMYPINTRVNLQLPACMPECCTNINSWQNVLGIRTPFMDGFVPEYVPAYVPIFTPPRRFM